MAVKKHTAVHGNAGDILPCMFPRSSPGKRASLKGMEEGGWGGDGLVQAVMPVLSFVTMRDRCIGMLSVGKRPDIEGKKVRKIENLRGWRLGLAVVLGLCFFSSVDCRLSLPPGATAKDITIVPNSWNINITDITNMTGDESSLILLNLNELVTPLFGGQELERGSITSAFYITTLPTNGKLYQAYRPLNCPDTWPTSCNNCCNQKFRRLPSGVSTCCADHSDLGIRLFAIGELITSVPMKVVIAESGFLWYRPAPNTTGVPYDNLTFTSEFWRKDLPPQFSTLQDSGCTEERRLCALGHAARCNVCSDRSVDFTTLILVQAVKKYPQVGFGGYMIAFDGQFLCF